MGMEHVRFSEELTTTDRPKETLEGAYYLTGVLSTRKNARADHVVCDRADPIQTVALSVSQNWHLYLLQCLGEGQ